MGSLQITSSREGNVTVIVAKGNLDVENATEFNNMLEAEIENGAKNIVFNMQYVEYVASAGFGALIGINETLQKTGGEIRISQINQEKVQKIFKLMGFTNIFKIFDTTDKAIQSFDN